MFVYFLLDVDERAPWRLARRTYIKGSGVSLRER